jgi:hypothetical protein
MPCPNWLSVYQGKGHTICETSTVHRGHTGLHHFNIFVAKHVGTKMRTDNNILYLLFVIYIYRCGYSNSLSVYMQADSGFSLCIRISFVVYISLIKFNKTKSF